MVRADRQRRVLRGRAEVPRGFGRLAVAVDVQGVPAGVDAARRRRRLQLRGGAALGRGRIGVVGDVRRVPVAGCGRAVRDAVQTRAARTGHRAGRVARRHRAAGAVPAHQTRRLARRRGRVHRRRRVAGDHRRAPSRQPQQAADDAAAVHRARRPHRRHAGAADDAASEQADPVAGRDHAGVRHAQPRDRRAVHHAEQPLEAGCRVHEQVVDHVAVAVEDRPERIGAVADRRPAAAAVVVGVAGVAGRRAAGPRGTVAVGVEVQVRHQLVARADRRAAVHRTPHPCRVARKGGAVGGFVGRRRRAGAAQIPAHGVQLRQRRDLDQAVVVDVVVDGRAVVVHQAHAQEAVHGVVAAAVRHVRDRRRLAERIEVLQRLRGQRPPGGPVLPRERQRRGVHGHQLRVVDRDRHGDVGGRLHGQRHRVARRVQPVSARLVQHQRPGILPRRTRHDVHQHFAAIVVRHRRRHLADVAEYRHGVGDRNRFVVRVVVRQRPHGHRARRRPVGRGERQHALIAGRAAVDVHRHRRGGACHRQRHRVGRRLVEPHRVRAGVGARALVQRQRGAAQPQLEGRRHRHRRRRQRGGPHVRRRGDEKGQGLLEVEVRVVVGQRQRRLGVSRRHRRQRTDGEARHAGRQREVRRHDAARVGRVDQLDRQRGAVEVRFLQLRRVRRADDGARGVGAVHLVRRAVRDGRGAQGERRVLGAAEDADGAAVQRQRGGLDAQAVGVRVRRHDGVAEDQLRAAVAGRVRRLAGLGTDHERELRSAGHVHRLVEGDGGLDGLAHVVGVAQRRGVQRHGGDRGRAGLAVHLVLRGVGEGEAAEADVRSHGGVAVVVDLAAVQRQGALEDADAVGVEVAGLHDVAEAQPGRGYVAEQGHLLRLLANGQGQLRRAGDGHCAVEVDAQVDALAEPVGLVVGRGAAEEDLVDLRRREPGAVHLAVAAVCDGVGAEAEDGVPGALHQPDGAAVQRQRGRGDADAVRVDVRLHQLVAEHQRIGAGTGCVARLAGVRADAERQLGRAGDVHHAVERDRGLDGLATLVGVAGHRRVERDSLHFRIGLAGSIDVQQ